MDIIAVTLGLLACVVASSALQRLTQINAPLALVQIAIGALVAALFGFRVTLPADVFLLLFVAPLLFLDAWRVPKQALLHNLWTISSLAVGLVLLTVFSAGLFIWWLLPIIPLPIALALAAVLSPTDAVAISGMAEKMAFPGVLLQILQGEALLNDASGLVGMRFALSAAVTGAFSLQDASVTFLWLAAGGIGAGTAIAWLANTTKDWVARRFGEETGAQILVSLLIPFGAYMVADRIGASGILAAVAAGIAMSYEELSGRALALTRIRRAAVWDAVQFAGNGVVFVVLGQQLTGIVAAAQGAFRSTGQLGPLWIVADIVAITAVLAAIRSVWVWVTIYAGHFRHVDTHPRWNMPVWRLVAIASFSGVRGAVTLSAVMTFPFILRGGDAFPSRNLVILLAGGVIVMTLLVADLALPRLTGPSGTTQESARQQDGEDARGAAARAAIAAMNRAQSGQFVSDPAVYAAARNRIVAQYRRKIEASDATAGDSHSSGSASRVERELRLLALQAERAEMYRLSRLGRLSDELAQRLVYEIDIEETYVSLEK